MRFTGLPLRHASPRWRRHGASTGGRRGYRSQEDFEHGIGQLKRQWRADERDAVSFDVQFAIKKAVDRAGILNPGRAF